MVQNMAPSIPGYPLGWRSLYRVPGGALPVNGSVVVKPVTNTSYTLIAYGANGQAVSSVLYIFVR